MSQKPFSNLVGDPLIVAVGGIDVADKIMYEMSLLLMSYEKEVKGDALTIQRINHAYDLYQEWKDCYVTHRYAQSN